MEKELTLEEAERTLEAEKIVFTTEEECTFCGNGKFKFKEESYHELPVPNSKCTVFVQNKMCKSCTVATYHHAVTYQDPNWAWSKCTVHCIDENGECDDEFCISLY